jgi:hypothetical protein
VKLETSVELFVLVAGGNPHFCSTVEDCWEVELPASEYVLKSNNKISSGDIMSWSLCFEEEKCAARKPPTNDKGTELHSPFHIHVHTCM